MNARAIRIFCSYAHKDKELVEEIIKHVGRKYTLWWDVKIRAGDDWEKEIITHLHHAHIIFFLITADFMHSDYCAKIEIPQALTRRENGDAEVVPILLRPVHWSDAPYSHIQCIPTGAKPVTLWGNQDEAFADIAKHVDVVINKRLKILYVKEAQSCFSTGMMSQAYETCQLALDISYFDATLDQALGDQLYNLKCFDKALTAYEKALEFNKQNAALYRKIGDAHSSLEYPSLEHLDQALEAYDRAIALELSGVNCVEIMRKQAEVRLKRTKKQLRDKGNELDLARRSADALVLYNEAMKMDRDNPFLHKEKGDSLYNLLRIGEALTHYETAVSLLEIESNLLYDQMRLEGPTEAKTRIIASYTEAKTRIMEIISKIKKGISALPPEENDDESEKTSS